MAKKTEKQVRDGLMMHARRIGAAEDLQHTFDKWDRAIALAPPSEKTDMARAAILDVQYLLDICKYNGDGLTINDEVVTPAKQEK